jgi:hypothetical protein
MHKNKHSQATTAQTSKMPIEGLQALQANTDLWYKIHVLLHDVCNIATDRTAESRTLATTDELYISAPYFTPDEAALVKKTLILPPTLQEIPEFQQLEYEQNTTEEAASPADLINIKETTSPSSLITIEEAIKGCLQNFFEKRRASGDARPCGLSCLGKVERMVC